MLRKIPKLLPYLIIMMFFTILNAFLDAYVMIRLMGLLDIAIAGNMAKLTAAVPQILIPALLLIPLGLWISYLSSYYRKKAAIELKTYYVEKVFGKNIAEFQKENTATYISSLTNDFQTLQTNLIDGIYSISSSLASFAAGIWMISTVNGWMILLALAVTGINIIVSLVTSKPLNKSYKERSDMFDRFTAYIKEMLSAFHIIKNNNLQDKITEDYHAKSKQIQDKGYQIEKRFSYISALQNFFMSGSMYGVTCAIGYLVILGKATAGGLLLITEGIGRMAWPLFQISEMLPKLFTVRSLIRKIEDTLRNKDTYEETQSLDSFRESITLNNVSFRYEDSEDTTLEEVSMQLKKNGKYLIVGPSGGGKSTLLKLLRKYFNPSSGEILIDGKNLRDVKKQDFFSRVANIEQQVFLFEDSILNNVTLYKDYSQEAVKKAISDAGLSDFISSLPNGLDTVIYDNGKNISGGERSRLVIARALLTGADILFMDEAFASLDMERAKEIEKTILALEHITVINVSHVIFQDTKEQYDTVYYVKKNVKAA